MVSGCTVMMVLCNKIGHQSSHKLDFVDP